MTNANEGRGGDDGTLVLRHRNPLANDYVIASRVILIGYPQVSDGAKVTYWVIYSHDWYDPNQQGRKGYVYPTVGRLAQLRHTTERTIQRHLAELIEAGLLTRVIRHGKPSVLYIEEPSRDEIGRYQAEQSRGGDKIVRGGVTFLSPHKKEEKKQTNTVNGIEKTCMEEGSKIQKGWKPIKALLNANRLRKDSKSQTEWLADEIIAATGDTSSLGCFRLIAKRCSHELVFQALSLLKEAKVDRTIRRNSGALFVGIIRRLCAERSLPDPFDAQGASRALRQTQRPHQKGYSGQSFDVAITSALALSKSNRSWGRAAASISARATT